jgi:hypothetical protein
MDASGYADRPPEFASLLRVLDTELRLITPADPEGEGDEEATPAVGKHYQLAHDFLVSVLREWLTRKRRQTRAGRTELRLAERAALWSAKPEKRHLPSWWEWLNIHWFTRRHAWTEGQRRMMHAANRHHWIRAGIRLLSLTLVVWLTFEAVGYFNTHNLIRSFDTLQADDLAPYRRWAKPMLKGIIEKEAGSQRCAKAFRMLLDFYPDEIDYACAKILQADKVDYEILRKAALPHKQAVADRLWTVLEDLHSDPEKRIRAAVALAEYDRSGPRWTTMANETAELLMVCSPKPGPCGMRVSEAPRG